MWNGTHKMLYCTWLVMSLWFLSLSCWRVIDDQSRTTTTQTAGSECCSNVGMMGMAAVQLKWCCSVELVCEESLAPSLFFCSVSFRLPHTVLHFHQWQNQIQFSSSSNRLLTFITSIASRTSAEHIFQSQVVPLSKTAKCFDDAFTLQYSGSCYQQQFNSSWTFTSILFRISGTLCSPPNVSH